MTRECSRRGARRRADDGVALIEAAFVLPVVIIVVFGIIEVGLLFRSGSVATASSRSGARVAAALYGTTPGDASADSIANAVAKDLSSLQAFATPQTLWIYRADANGDPPDATCSTNCYRYTWNGTTFSGRAGGWGAPDACGASIDAVGVRVVVHHDSITGVLRTTTITERAIMRLEPKPFGACP